MSDLDQMMREVEELKDVLLRNGFVRCDIAACNCGSWHARYGYPQRMEEIREAITDAGHPPCNDNGNLTINALRELIAELESLRTAPALPAGDAIRDVSDEELMHAIINACDSLNITRVHELGGKTRTICDEAGLLEIGRAVRALRGRAG